MTTMMGSSTSHGSQRRRMDAAGRYPEDFDVPSIAVPNAAGI